MNHSYSYSKSQLSWLVVLRVLVGWYFLYEGVAKVLTSDWTCYGYLMDSKGLLAGFFKLLAENQTVLAVVDVLNIYGLILVGLSLILGLFNRIGCIGAISLLALYCVSHPALLDVTYVFRPEGSYLWVDKNLVMLGAVIVLTVFPTSQRVGLDRFLIRKKVK